MAYSTITPMATITFRVANRAGTAATDCVADVRFHSTPHGVDAGKVFSSKGEPEVPADTSEMFSFVYDAAPGAAPGQGDGLGRLQRREHQADRHRHARAERSEARRRARSPDARRPAPGAQVSAA